jgi:hypothetical protein
MIIEVTETIYKGILIERVKDEGWKCNLGGTEYLFPNYTAAQAAIDEIYHDIKPVIKKNKGEKLKGQPTNQEPQIALTPDERFEALKQSILNHFRADRGYFSAILDVVDGAIEALNDKDYDTVTYALDALAAELRDDLNNGPKF